MLSKLDLAVVGLSITLLYVIRLYTEFRRTVKLYNDFPGFRTVFGTESIFGNMFPPISGITLGGDRSSNSKHKDFKRFGLDAYLSISAFPASATYFISDAAAIKDIISSRINFPKSVDKYDILAFFGRNIIVSEFDEWKRFRKICAPSFNEKNFELVWNETTKNTLELFDNIWGKENKVVTVDHCVKFATPLAMFVIASAGFGRDVSWYDHKLPPPPGHKMSFSTAITEVTHGLYTKLLTPNRLLRWAPTKHLQTVRDAFDELRLYLEEMIKERDLPGQGIEKADLLSRLLGLNDLENEKGKLDDVEVIGNIFIFLLAGHETTAHTLTFVMALLALYPDEQELLFEHIKEVLGDGKVPRYEDMSKLSRVTAVLYETLRLFPPAPNIPKTSAIDTTITVSNEAGENVILPVPKGTVLVLHAPGLHYNPRYWKDPYAFNPSRFLGDWPKDAYVAFSAGARACIGRGFFEVTGVAFITLLVSHYKFEVMEEPRFAGETFEEKRARVTHIREAITTTPTRVPLVFKRR